MNISKLTVRDILTKKLYGCVVCLPDEYKRGIVISRGKLNLYNNKALQRLPSPIIRWFSHSVIFGYSFRISRHFFEKSNSTQILRSSKALRSTANSFRKNHSQKRTSGVVGLMHFTLGTLFWEEITLILF